MAKYVLKTLNNKRGRHIHRDGETTALCGFPISSGAPYFKRFQWVGQVDCHACLRVHAQDLKRGNDG